MHQNAFNGGAAPGPAGRVKVITLPRPPVGISRKAEGKRWNEVKEGGCVGAGSLKF